MSTEPNPPTASAAAQMKALMEQLEKRISPTLERIQEQMDPLMVEMQQDMTGFAEKVSSAAQPTLEQMQEQLVPVLAKLEKLLNQQGPSAEEAVPGTPETEPTD